MVSLADLGVDANARGLTPIIMCRQNVHALCRMWGTAAKRPKGTIYGLDATSRSWAAVPSYIGIRHKEYIYIYIAVRLHIGVSLYVGVVYRAPICRVLTYMALFVGALYIWSLYIRALCMWPPCMGSHISTDFLGSEL